LVLLLSVSSHAAVTHGSYLQQGTEHSMVIVWRTDVTTTPVVKFGKTLDSLIGTCASSNIVVRTTTSEEPLHTAPDGIFQYEATHTGPQPGSTYCDTLADGDAPLAAASRRIQ